MRPRILVPLAIGLLSALLALALWQGRGIRGVEGLVYDWKVKLLAKGNLASDEILIVGISDESMDRMEPVAGRWPWPREHLAGVLEYCSEARVISMDFLLSEPDVCADAVDGDRIFAAEASKIRRLVLSCYLSDLSGQDTPDSLPGAALPGVSGEGMAVFPSVILPYPELAAGHPRLGYVNYWRDPDDYRSRYVKLAARAGDHVLPSLALATFMAAEELEPSDLRFEADRLLVKGEKVRLGDPSMHRHGRNNLWLDWRPGEQPYARVDAADVLSSYHAEAIGNPEGVVVPRSAFADKIVLVGMEATGLLRDREATPVHSEIPGVAIHATAIDNLMQRRAIWFLPPAWTLLLILVAGLLPPLAGVRRPLSLLLLYLGLSALLVALSVVAAFLARLMVPVVAPAIALGLSSGALAFLYWRGELRRRHRLERLDHAKQQFTDMLVHDLKNTVAPVLMSAELVRKDPTSDFSRDKFPYYVQCAYDQLLLQVNSLLDIRKMEEGRLILNPERSLPLALIRQIISAHGTTLKHMDLELSLEEGEGADHPVHLDELVFRRVIENLLWNAIKYSVPLSRIHVFATSDETHYEIRVFNHCVPVPADKLERMFGAFVTGDQPRTIGNITSTGLGLAFCKLAIEGHAGSIRLDSPPAGKEDGFQVTLRLPFVME